MDAYLHYFTSSLSSLWNSYQSPSRLCPAGLLHLMPDGCWNELAKVKDLAIYRQALTGIHQLHQNSPTFLLANTLSCPLWYHREMKGRTEGKGITDIWLHRPENRIIPFTSTSIDYKLNNWIYKGRGIFLAGRGRIC